MDSWKTTVSFWGYGPIFRGELLVFRECILRVYGRFILANIGIPINQPVQWNVTRVLITAQLDFGVGGVTLVVNSKQ